MRLDQFRLRMIGPLAAAAMLSSGGAWAGSQTGLAARGEALVARDCARCHAVGRTGESPLAAAPVFRRLHERYDVEALAEGLAEGLTVGHGPMPEWTFAPDDIAAIVAYLKSIQASDNGRSRSGRAPTPAVVPPVD